MRKVITTFLLMLSSYFSFSQVTDATFIPAPVRTEVIKEFKFENNNAEGFVTIVPPQNLPDRWHRRKISQVRTLNSMETDEGAIVASSTSNSRKLFVVRSPIIEIPSISGMNINKTLHVLSINHECTFNVNEVMGEFPAKITLHFLESGYKYDYYVNTDGMTGVKIPFHLSKDGYNWHGTRMSIELSFFTKPNTFWMIKDIRLSQYNYNNNSSPINIYNFIPLGSRSGSSGTGTSGPTGPRN
jgi:hypothetical protein